MLSTGSGITFGKGTHNPEENKFLNRCENYLLSNEVTADNKISQVDVAAFLVNYSIKEVGICTGLPEDECTNITFSSLDVALQLAYVWSLCPLDLVNLDRQKCLQELSEHGDEFGWILSGSQVNLALISGALGDFCEILWILGHEFHGNMARLPTQFPSTVVTNQPSIEYSLTPSTIPSIITGEYTDRGASQESGGKSWSNQSIIGTAILVSFIVAQILIYFFNTSSARDSNET